MHLILLGLLLSLPSRTILVSSSTGNDNLGVDDAGTSSPGWRTLAKVQRHGLRPGDTLLLRRGDRFEESLWLYGSGTSEDPIVVGAWGQGSAPVVDGTAELRHWIHQGGAIWRHAWNSEAPDMYWYYGRVPLARWPKMGGAKALAGSAKDSLVAGLPVSDLAGARVVVRSTPFDFSWDTLQRNTRTYATLKAGSRRQQSLRPGLEFWVTGHRALITRSGDWIWDGNGILMYSAGSPVVRASLLPYGLRIVQGDHWILQDLEIRGFTRYGILTRGSNIRLRNLLVRDAGHSGIFIADGSGIQVDSCRIRDIGSNGIESYASDVAIRGGEVSGVMLDRIRPIGGGTTSAHGTGITIRGARSEVRGVAIDRIGYDGVKSTGPDAVVAGNTITNFCQTMSDGGGVYLSGRSSSGSRVDSNRIRTDSTTRPEEGTYLEIVAGVYLDEASHGDTVRSNHIQGGGRGVFLHNARGNVVVENTILGYARHGIAMEQDGGAPDSLRDNHVHRNRVAASGASLVRLKKTTSWSSPGTIEANIYGIPRDLARFERDDLARNRWGAIPWYEWSMEGFDTGSTFDP